jgi:uncharacterized protein YegL
MFDMFGQEAGSTTRRLPVYLLLDTSGSMSGAKIQAVNQGIQLIHNELLNNPQALDTVHIAVITFNTTAQMASPLVDLLTFKAPTLRAEGVTMLAEGLALLNQSFDRDLIANTPQQKGDYKPLVFLLTDGIPTNERGEPSNNWQPAIQAIRSRAKNKVGTIIALGIGGDDEIDESVLKSVGDVALKMTNVNSDTIQSFFKWVSASVSTASVAANRGQEGGAQVQQPPAAIQLVF